MIRLIRQRQLILPSRLIVRYSSSSSLKSTDSQITTDEILSENNPWSPSLEDDPVYIYEPNNIRRTKLPDNYRLSYNELYESPSYKHVSIMKRFTLSFSVIGLYGGKLLYESPQFDNLYSYLMVIGTLLPAVLVQYKSRDYVTRIFRLYDKSKPQTYENLVNDEQLIIEKLSFWGSKTYNELLKLTDNKNIKIDNDNKWYKPYSTWIEKTPKWARKFYVVDNIGGMKMDRVWGLIEKDSGINNGR
ncbi:unnamed protein product [Candida verbasci]|uniref:Uncharacterized protein n=1 Tax=Candida verbasci TaxID=1227364 RepID=A0A9W4U0T3_9ASCO|nr:unnamed protein product [Candida verbasci]